MMKKRHILHWAMGVVMTPLLGSCAADDIGGAGRDECDIILGQPMAVTSVTKAVDGRTSSNFESGEEVWLWANKNDGSSTEYIKAWKLTAQSGGSFSGTAKYWPSDGSSLNVYAIHGNFKNSPSISEGTTQWSSLTALTHTVETDQSSDVNKRLSDLLYSHASSAAAPNNGSVQLTFDHLLAKITVKLDLSGSQGITASDLANATVTLTNIQPDATFTSSNGEAASAGGSRTPITAGKPTSVSDGAVIGSAIVPLQEFGATNSNKITIKLTDNRSFSYTPADVTLGKGNQYIYTLKILGKHITGTLSVSPFDTEDKPISFNDDFDYLADLKNRAYLGSADAPHDLSYDYNGLMNTANCYVVTHPGYYKIPLVYGNAIKNGATNSIAYGVKEGSQISTTFVNHLGDKISDPYIYNNSGCTVNSASLVWQDAPNLISNNIALCDDNKYIKFEITKENIEQGNAVIAVKHTDGTIMWSWHIWVTNKNVYETYTYGDYKFMPIALGQRETEEGTTCTFYQWGRKDPFRKSGHTVESGGVAQSIAIQNPGIFYISSSDWSSPQNNYGYDYWNVGNTSNNTSVAVNKSIYDPSPAGYKLPPCAAFSSLNMNTDGFKWSTKGYSNTSNNDFWHAFGFLTYDVGSLGSDGTYGYYWSASPNSNSNGYHLDFYDGVAYPQNGHGRAYGFSVRPVSE